MQLTVTVNAMKIPIVIIAIICEFENCACMCSGQVKFVAMVQAKTTGLDFEWCKTLMK